MGGLCGKEKSASKARETPAAAAPQPTPKQQNGQVLNGVHPFTKLVDHAVSLVAVWSAKLMASAHAGHLAKTHRHWTEQ